MRAALLIALLALGCATKGDGGLQNLGDAYETLCVKGQLSAEQAAAVNAIPAKRPSYCLGQTTKDGTNGDVHCDAEAKDRILAAHCSRASRQLFEGR